MILNRGFGYDKIHYVDVGFDRGGDSHDYRYVEINSEKVHLRGLCALARVAPRRSSSIIDSSALSSNLSNARELGFSFTGIPGRRCVDIGFSRVHNSSSR